MTEPQTLCAACCARSRGLNGKAIHHFAINPREWRALRRAAKDGCLEFEPRGRRDFDARLMP
jgi:hypothetical protein